MMIPVTKGVKVGPIITLYGSRPINNDRNYPDPINVAMLYRYRVTILNFDKKKQSEIEQWCNENCFCKVEIIILQASKNQWTCICAFEKKIDCVGFKLWW